MNESTFKNNVVKNSYLFKNCVIKRKVVCEHAAEPLIVLLCQDLFGFKKGKLINKVDHIFK